MVHAEVRWTGAALFLAALLSCTTTGSTEADPVGFRKLEFRQVVQKAKDKVFPTVVFIKCIRESLEAGEKISQEISGSGVIISADGDVLTNWHVIEKAVEVRCLLYDGRAMTANVVAKDKDTDLALIRLERPADDPPLPYADLGDSTILKEGDFVMAMGAPWGLSRSVSIGIVSCTRRFLPAFSQYSLWLQTDASISPGNSGGPLVNTDGEIVGINTRGVSMGGDMGFAVPSDTIASILARIRQHGKMNWSWTGLQLQPLRDFDKNIYFEASEGVIVAGTDPESPARQAGILPHDRIVRVNGTAVVATTEEDLPAVRRMLGMLPEQEEAKIELVRGKTAMTLTMVPRDKGKVEGDDLACKRWNLTVKTINQFEHPDLHFYKKEGVFIYGMSYPGNASTSGLRSQDIILKIDGKEISTLKEVTAAYEKAMKALPNKHRIVLEVLRGGLMNQVVLDFSRDHERE